jgi:DNA polymerase
MTLPIGSGNPNARIMLVGEAWGADEARAGKPFVGVSGMELDRMLHEVGIMRSECYVSNVVNAQPAGNDIRAWIPLTKREITPDCVRFRDRMVKPIIVEGYRSLLKEIALVKPTLIVALGNTSLYALTGRWGIVKWRGSQLTQNAADLIDEIQNPPPKVIPTYHPAAILRQWDWRAIALNDLRRAKREAQTVSYRLPQWTFIIRPSLVQALGTLGALYERCQARPTLLSFDLETRAGHIACAGIAWDKENALCLPFMAVSSPEGYWAPEEEALVLEALYAVLYHPNARVLGQNLLYDAQYTWKWWHFVPRITFDTMVAHHTAFPGLPKALDFQSSMYASFHRYWKDDGKEWKPEYGEEQFWRYNCEDAVRTFEIAEALGVSA